MNSLFGSAPSAFAVLGLRKSISLLLEEITELYLADSIPWVIGYSGGKDSTTALQLVWLALMALPADKRNKPVYVISTDTLVENPIVALWVTKSLQSMSAQAQQQGLPITTHRLTPQLKHTFWVNLIGRGYAAPRPKFRWCTDRLKIAPSTNFIRSVVDKNGQVILVLGTRKAESAARARSMERFEKGRVRDRLSPNGSIPDSFVYSPLEEWSNDDVWQFLMQFRNPWGHDNKNLLGMYQGATPDGECPLVIDTSTPSCGSSRFGCWVCTMVDQDKSMAAMIRNDQEKEWMLPLLQLRNEFAPSKTLDSDRSLRDFRRMNGKVQLFHDRLIHGPYIQSARENWLRKVLQTEQTVRQHSPPEVQDLKLISLEELHEIRRIWVYEKHEIEDALPRIYEEVTGEPFPGQPFNDLFPITPEMIEILREVCGKEEIRFQMVRELLSIQLRHRTPTRRQGMYEAMEQAILRHSHGSEAEALEWARRREEKTQQELHNLRTGHFPQDSEEGDRPSDKDVKLTADRERLNSVQRDLFD